MTLNDLLKRTTSKEDKNMEIKLLGNVTIAEKEFTGIEGGFGEGKKAMLAKDIAEIHGKEVKHINEAINKNRERFRDNIEIIDIKGLNIVVDLTDHNIFTKMQVSKAKNIYLLSERGYAKLLKIMEDDLAWDLYDKFVDEYFSMRAVQRKLSRKELAQMVIEAEEEIERLENKVEEQKEEIIVHETTIDILTTNHTTFNDFKKIARALVNEVSLYTGKPHADIWKNVYIFLYRGLSINVTVRQQNAIDKENALRKSQGKKEMSESVANSRYSKIKMIRQDEYLKVLSSISSYAIRCGVNQEIINDINKM